MANFLKINKRVYHSIWDLRVRVIVRWRDSGATFATAAAIAAVEKKASKQHFANIFAQYSSIESRMEKARALAIQSRFDIQVNFLVATLVVVVLHT